MQDLIELPRYKKCFVCGKDNPIGLDITFYASRDLDFYKDKERVLADKKVFFDFVPQQKHIGWKNTQHGGITASLLDESMFWAVAVNTGNIYFTTEMTVKYLKAVILPVSLKGVAWALVKKRTAKIQDAYAELRDESGNLYATAKGRYFAIPKDKLPEFLDDLYYESNPEQKFSLDLL